MEAFRPYFIRVFLEHSLVEISVINGSKYSVKGLKRFYKSLAEQTPGCDQKPGQMIQDYNMIKIETDLYFLLELMSLLIEKYSLRNLEYVDSTLSEIGDIYYKEYELMENYDKNKKLHTYLEVKVGKDQDKYKLKLRKCDEQLFDQENDLKSITIDNAMKRRVVSKWEKTRHEQTQAIFERDSAKKREQLHRANDKYANETRIFNEIEIFTRVEIRRLEDLTEEWQSRYDRECFALDNGIRLTAIKIESAKESIHNLQSLYTRRNQEIADYLEHKRKMAEVREQDQLKWISAVKIQAWWRGTMVRNGLGPYKRKKKCKKGKSAKKKR